MSRPCSSLILILFRSQVVKLLSKCNCPIQFHLEHLSEGKYRIGDTKTLIFVRVCFVHLYCFAYLKHFLFSDSSKPCHGSSGRWMVRLETIFLSGNYLTPFYFPHTAGTLLS